MFGPLEFPYESKQSISNEVVNVLPNTGEIVICILCDKEYKCPNEKDSLLGHIFEEHKIVIADVHLISNLPKIHYLKGTSNIGSSDSLRLLSQNSVLQFLQTLKKMAYLSKEMSITFYLMYMKKIKKYEKGCKMSYWKVP